MREVAIARKTADNRAHSFSISETGAEGLQHRPRRQTGIFFIV
jgi:hypothetical protein